MYAIVSIEREESYRFMDIRFTANRIAELPTSFCMLTHLDVFLGILALYIIDCVLHFLQHLDQRLNTSSIFSVNTTIKRPTQGQNMPRHSGAH
jgi:hypothetical protein